MDGDKKMSSKWQDFLESKKDKSALPAQGKNAKPYYAPKLQNDGKTKVLVVEKPTDALGDKGTPELKNPKDCHPLGKKMDYSGLKSEAFLNETADMSSSEFIKSMIVEAKKKEKDDSDDDDSDDGIPPMTCQYTGATVVPSAMEAAKFTARMLGKNAKARKAFIRELNRSEGGLGSLLGELTGHGEMYSELVNQMGMPENKVAKRLVGAMHQHHSSFMNDMGLMTGEGGATNAIKESVDEPLSKRLGLDGGNDVEDDDSDMDDQDPNAMGDDDSDMDAQGPDDMGGDDMGGMDGGDDMGGDEMDGMDVNKKPNGMPGNATPQMKLNKEFAYHHMIKEMSKFDHMSNAMREILGG